jgi:hypothetical protein
MIAIERGKLIPVTGDNDNPDLENAIDVQFNPTSLKVSLSNTIKENARNGSSRSAQFVDKSSSNLTVELIFDATYIEQPDGAQGNNQTAASSSNSGGSRNNIQQGSDVRLYTRKIADTFIKPVAEGDKLKAPRRCLFQWGAFEFLGMVQSFDETLDFFSPEGRPLRATISLKLSEDRYQFRTREVKQAERNALSLSSTGASGQGGVADQNVSPVPGGSGNQAGNWRDTAMFNGIESPRLPSLAAIAVPKLTMSASLGISGGTDSGINAGIPVNSETGAGVAGKASQQRIKPASPAFRFGNSASLGTGIEGAFNPGGQHAALNAASLQTGGVLLRAGSNATSMTDRAGLTASVGGVRPISAAKGHQQNVSQRTGWTSSSNVTVAGLVKKAADSGIGFD